MARMSKHDEQEWSAYVLRELDHFYAVSGGGTYIWANTPGAHRALSRRGVTSTGAGAELAAFRGPWLVVRPLVTREFRQWVEEDEGTRRLTPAQFVESQREARESLSWYDSPEFTRDRLAEIRRLMDERDALIVEAAARRASKVEIAAATGLSRQQVHAIIASAGRAPVVPVAVGGFGEYEWVTLPDGTEMEVERAA